MKINDLNQRSDFKKMSDSEILKSNYSKWMNYREKHKEGFFMVPNSLFDNKYIQAINNNSISLYLYYGYRSKNKTGESWPSIERIAEDLQVSEKSVNTWNNTLEDIGLIYRNAEGKSSKITYLLPTSDYLYKENILTVEEVINNNRNPIDGKIICILHLFQWRKENASSTDYTKPYNLICIASRRKHNRVITITVDKYVLIDKNVPNLKISITADEFENEDIYAFDFPENYPKIEGIRYFGLAIKKEINLKELEKDNKVMYTLSELIKHVEINGEESFKTDNKVEAMFTNEENISN